MSEGNMEFKGTPGPWKGMQSAYNRYVVVDSGGYEFLLAAQASNSNAQGVNRANVQLAGAAPELLEALQECVFRLEYLNAAGIAVDHDVLAINKAREAINKALGEE